MKYNSEVTLGHLIQVGTIIGACVVAWIAFEHRIAAIEFKTSELSASLKRHEEIIAELSKIEQQNVVNQAKIQTILELKLK